MPVNNKIQQTKKRLLEALEQSLGVVSTACKKVKVDRTTFYRYYNNDKKFKEEVDNIGEVAIDFVESNLFKQIKEGSTSATIFFLKCRAKKRGYTEVDLPEKKEEKKDNTLKIKFIGGDNDK